MIKTSLNQKGNAHIVIIVILVVALLGALGFVFWQNFLNKKQATNTANTEQNTSDGAKEPTNTKTYKNDTIGISFTYPKDWVSVTCNNDQSVVYFGSDNRGIGINDGTSILCGGGTDFPPQMTFSIKKNFSYEGDGQATDVMIDGKAGKKYTHTTGNESVLPGLETTTYVVKIDSENSAVLVYNKWSQDSSGSYDTSSATKQEFVNLVEKSLRFL